jgi:hypothetical protein
LGELRPARQKRERRCDYSLLLASIDALGWQRQAAALPLPDFHENENLPVQHDKIKFAAPTMKIPFELDQAFAAQKRQGAAFAVKP